MPRPKVKPQDRRRSVRACLSCKFSKIRCDGQSPCAACVRRSRRDRCMYATSPRRISASAVEHAGASQISPEVGVHPSNVDCERGSAPAGICSHQDAVQAVPQATCSPDPTRSLLSQSTQSRTLISSKGEKLFVGAASSLSFLQFVRQVVQRCTGPSAFTESTNFMLEVSPIQRSDNEAAQLGKEITLQHEEHLIGSFFELTSGILDLCTQDELLDSLRKTWSQGIAPGHANHEVRRPYSALLLLVLAIGTQCQDSHASDRSYAAAYFAKAQTLAFQDFLCDPSIELIRIFMLMAFYMLGACHRNAACMYLGVAAKAASTLGLHQKEQYGSCTLEEARLRLRCWRCLRVMDTLVSTILGRTSSVSSMYSTVDDIKIDVVSSNALVLDAMYRICIIIEEAQQQLSRGPKLDFDIAEDLLGKLGTWTQSLPRDLRNFTVQTGGSPGDEESRKQLIGACHVACSYYFSVAVITRPFLIAHLMAQVQSRAPDDEQPLPAVSPTEKQKAAELAQACIESATLMAQICADAVQSKMLHDNMCILKAWVFAAGLLLGFSLFVEEETESTRSAVATAYNNCCAVLHRFSHASPQAEHYYDILNNFADAITQYHQQLAENRQRSAKHSQYVHRIFSISTSDPEPQRPQQPQFNSQSPNWESVVDDDEASALVIGDTIDESLYAEDSEKWAIFLADISASSPAFTTFF